MTGCTELPEDVAQKLTKRVNLPQICSVLSGEDGVFVFPSVPSGDYTLVKTLCFSFFVEFVYEYSDSRSFQTITSY